MPADRRNFVNQLMEMWTRLQWSQRFTIIFFAFLGMALIGSVAYFMNQVEYDTLYSNLKPADAIAVKAELKKRKINPKVEGASILVPKDQIDELRMEMGKSGLAENGNLGWKIFDEPQWGMTPELEQINLQRALQGELQRTIESLAEISEARVHLVMCKDAPFEENKEDAKASVVLTLKNGVELSKSNIAGIKGVVAGAVRGLHSYNVSIMDNMGKIISPSVDAGDAARVEMESGFREQKEKEASEKVESMLEQIVGRGNVHAYASVDVDFNSSEQTEETVNPNPQAILNHAKTEERAGGQAGAAGIPGLASNVGSATPQTVPASPERVRQSESTNFDISRSVTHTVRPKGKVRRLSVAVAVNNKTVQDKTSDGKAASHEEPRTPQEMSTYRDLVLAAVGFDASRNDVVTIQNVPFYSELKKPVEPAAAAPWYKKLPTQSYLLPGIKYAAFIVLFIIAYLVFVRPVRKRVFQALSTSVPAAITGQAAAAGLTAAEFREAQLAAGGTPKALAAAAPAERIAAPAAAAGLPAGEMHLPEAAMALDSASDEEIERELMREANVADMGNRKYSVMKKRLSDKAKKDPEVVSQLIRTFLHEKA